MAKLAPRVTLYCRLSPRPQPLQRAVDLHHDLIRHLQRAEPRRVLLAESSVTIPEIGTIRATHPPAVVLTSNRTRDLHDALKRRCLYHWIDYPSPEREVEIVRRRVPGTQEELAAEAARAVRRLRESDVQKPPGIAETIDWVAALEILGVERLSEAAAKRTLGSVLKYREDQEQIAERASTGWWARGGSWPYRRPRRRALSVGGGA